MSYKSLHNYPERHDVDKMVIYVEHDSIGNAEFSMDKFRWYILPLRNDKYIHTRLDYIKDFHCIQIRKFNNELI